MCDNVKSTLKQRCVFQRWNLQRQRTSNQRYAFHFNFDMNNVRQLQNNVVIFNVEFHNVAKLRNNVLKMIISKKNKKNLFQIEYTEFKVLTTIS